MFSMQSLLSRDGKWFTLLESGAEDARRSFKILVRFLNGREESRSLALFIETRRNEQRIVKQITEELLATFLTPLERQDIEALSEALAKIPKAIEKFAERVLIAEDRVAAMTFSQHLAMLERAVDLVALLVGGLRSGIRLSTAQSLNDQLQKIESDADDLLLKRLHELYTGDHSAVKVIVLKDLYQMMERIFDRCRDVGNIVFGVALKYS
jgi:uncharacterized protein Yka (UPF0111/DUF47 family)